jgi:UDP-2,4-diacetamido-2,4,6-trideoxy-beta-L-altropyranose hydrolase
MIFRVDAGGAVAMGHLMRSIALAEAARDRDTEVLFVTSAGPALVERTLTPRRFAARVIDKLDVQRDVDQTLLAAGSVEDTWVVIDGYHFGAQYHLALTKEHVKTLYIDDCAHLPFYCTDVVLNQNIWASADSYHLKPGTTVLTGSTFALLRPEFAKAISISDRVPRQSRRSRIVVTMGGTDPNDVTTAILNALAGSEITDIEVVAVLGASNDNEASVRVAMGALGEGSRLVIGVEDMAALLATANVAVAGAGTTAWELAFLGVPTILMVLADNQGLNAHALESVGAMIVASNAEAVPKLVANLLSNQRRREQMRLISRRLVDGRGAARVLDYLDYRTDRGPAPLFREATISDAAALWQLASDRSVRVNAFTTEPIPFESHLSWLEGKLNSADTAIYVMHLGDVLVAQVRYDRRSDGAAEIDYAVAPQFRGRGFGATILRHTAGEAAQRLHVSRIVGVVKESNQPSVRAFEKAGFSPAGVLLVGDERCVMFETHV